MPAMRSSRVPDPPSRTRLPENGRGSRPCFAAQYRSTGTVFTAPFSTHVVFLVGRPADPADEVDPSVRARVADPEERRQDLVLQERDVQAIGSRRVGSGGPEVEGMPASVEVHRDLARARRGLRARSDRDLRPERVEEVLGRPAPEVPDEAVVGQDLHLVVREGDREERVGLE